MSPSHQKTDGMTRVEQRVAKRAGVDVELTYQAFQLPGVYDKHSLVQTINPKQLKREFYAQPTGKAKVGLFAHGKEKENADGGKDMDKAKEHDLYMLDEEESRDNTDNYSRVRHLIFSQALRQNIARLESKNINFSDIVDIDTHQFESHITEDLAARFGEGDTFRIFILLVILLNSILIGVQTDEILATNYSSIFHVLDHCFLAVFIVEIVFKWYYGFASFWKSGWNWFDLVIVVAALAGPAFTFLSNSRILRILRVLRAFRQLRSVPALAGLQAVVATILRSIPDMANVALLSMILIFIFSVVGVTLFGAYDTLAWGDLGDAAFSLFVLMTQDGWVDMFDRLEAKGQFIPAAIFFFSFITLGAFILANVISAVVVAAYNETSAALKKAHEMKFRALKTELKATTGQKHFQRPVVEMPLSDEKVWSSQVPLEVPDFDKISKEKLERYFLVLSVIEENLREYVLTKEEIQVILLEIRNLNARALSEDDEDDDDYDDDDDDEEQGDVLSRMFKLGK